MRLALCLFLVSTVSLAKTYKPTSPNEVTWVATGNPGFLTIEGEGGKLDGSIDVTDGKAKGTLTVDLKPYKTGLDLRDEHMHEKYLETGKYPKAKLVLESWPLSEKESPFTGKLTLKDVTKDVTGKGSFKNGVLTAKMTVKINDFNVGVPSWLGVTVAEDVEVKVKVKFE